jgi:MFS family permease
MRSVLSKTWALFFGFAIICLAHGLQGTLLGVRAIVEGFGYVATGFVIAGFYVGYLSGSILIPIFLQRVGHIRVFAALASLASIAILLHSVFLDPLSWFFIRILTGISMSGIVVIVESWLNNRSTNSTRGKLLSIYMIITFSFLGLGQFLLNLSEPIKVDLFILVSILLSFALLPILLTVTEAPNFTRPKRFSLKKLFIVSPLGFVGAFVIGLTNSAIFGYGAVYATVKELDIFQISLFMFIISVFGALFQWPIGFLSDRIDRRIILIGTTLIASGLCILIVASSYISLLLFFIIIAFYAGMSLPMYSLAIAHINDFLQSDEMVSAIAAFAILYGLGSIFGPIFASLFMNIFGADGFFVYLFIIHIFLGLFGLYRMSKRAKSDDLESQYVPLPRNITATGMELNPNLDLEK